MVVRSEVLPRHRVAPLDDRRARIRSRRRQNRLREWLVLGLGGLAGAWIAAVGVATFVVR